VVSVMACNSGSTDKAEIVQENTTTPEVPQYRQMFMRHAGMCTPARNPAQKSTRQVYIDPTMSRIAPRPSPLKRFVRGVLKGLSAPTLISFPRERDELMRRMPKTVQEAWRRDWGKIGGDLWKVIHREEKILKERRQSDIDQEGAVGSSNQRGRPFAGKDRV
jgi:hypothetical protein